MIAKRIIGCTHTFGAPKQWNPERDGKCASLALRVVGDLHESAWEPTPAELAALNAGGHVVLCVKGGQPPVRLYVEISAAVEPEQAA